MTINRGMWNPRDADDDELTEIEFQRNRPPTEAQVAHSELTRTSSVPAGAFDIDDPMIEADLTDSAMRVLLQNMTGLASDDLAIDESLCGQAQFIDPAEISATRVQMAEFGTVESPDLDHDIEYERLWILIDLATKGDGATRRRATLELREQVEEIENSEVPKDVLRRLANGLYHVRPRALQLDLLLAATEQALAGADADDAEAKT